MALTRNLRRTGRAGATVLKEYREFIRDEQEQARKEFSDKWIRNMDALKAIDANWEAWYDARPEQTAKELLPLIVDRVNEMEAAILLPAAQVVRWAWELTGILYFPTGDEVSRWLSHRQELKQLDDAALYTDSKLTDSINANF